MLKTELNKKLAEWAFPNKIIKVYPFAIEIWDDRDNLVTILNPLTQSLDACFKWLVPEDTRCIHFIYSGDYLECNLIAGNGNRYWSGRVGKGAEALALCLAIEKLIDAESK